jgi:hypothetical protein
MTEVLEMTLSSPILDMVDINSSVIPSAKYLSLGSGLMFVNGRTDAPRVEGLSGGVEFDQRHHSVEFYRVFDVLKLAGADADQVSPGLPTYLVEDLSGHADSAGLGERFYPSCHVHGVTEDVAA